MLLALSVISVQGAGMGSTAYKIFDERGGSIGRIDTNDWSLPDPEKVVSSAHAEVRFTSGSFYLRDLSTNGTYINSREQAVPRDAANWLADGDRIFIGEYEILVQIIDDGIPAIDAGSDSRVGQGAFGAAAAPAGRHSPVARENTDPLAALGRPREATSGRGTAVGLQSQAGVKSSNTGHTAPRSRAAISIPADWQLTGFRRPGRASPPVRQTDSRAVTAPSTRMPGTAPENDTGAHEMLKALGLDPRQADRAIYKELAEIIRIVIQGTIEVLRVRAEVKNNFRMPMTSLRPIENNPLKFSMNAEDALRNLFLKRNAAWLEPPEAFKEGFQDLTFHELAMLAGIRAAYQSMVAKLRPGQLEQEFAATLKRSSKLNLGQRPKFWELYRAWFEEVDADAEGSFQRLFGEEFAKAYREQLAALGASARER